MEKISMFLSMAYDFVAGSLMAQSAIIGMIVDFVLRFVKTEKPVDVIRAFIIFMNKSGAAIKWAIDQLLKLISLLEKVAEFLDKVLGQRLK
jgi:hypothetical protein